MVLTTMPGACWESWAPRACPTGAPCLWCASSPNSWTWSKIDPAYSPQPDQTITLRFPIAHGPFIDEARLLRNIECQSECHGRRHEEGLSSPGAAVSP